MPLTNFPQGVSSFGIPLLGMGPMIPGGKVVFVNNAHGNTSDGNTGEERDRPLRTLNMAFDKVSANAGDMIVVGPGHAETVSAAGQILFDVAGVSVIGLGRGSLRPTLTFDTIANAELTITASNIFWSNFLLRGGVDALATPIDINGGADCYLHNLEWVDAVGQATDVFIVRATADRTVIDGLVFRGATAAGANTAIAFIGVDDVEVKNFYIDGNFAVGTFECRTTASVNLRIHDGWVRTRNAADIIFVDTITGSTGMIGPNINARLNDNAANITEAFTGATFVYFQPINIVNNAGESSMQTNITASTDA